MPNPTEYHINNNIVLPLISLPYDIFKNPSKFIIFTEPEFNNNHDLINTDIKELCSGDDKIYVRNIHN